MASKTAKDKMFINFILANNDVTVGFVRRYVRSLFQTSMKL